MSLYRVGMQVPSVQVVGAEQSSGMGIGTMMLVALSALGIVAIVNSASGKSNPNLGVGSRHYLGSGK